MAKTNFNVINFLFVFPPALNESLPMHRSAPQPQAADPQIRAMLAELLPFSYDARIYGHQVCFSANISRILLIDGRDVAPAEGKKNSVLSVTELSLDHLGFKLTVTAAVSHEAYLNTKSAESISFPHLLFLMMPPFPTTAHFLNCDLE